MKKVVLTAVIAASLILGVGCAKPNVKEPSMVNDHAPSETLLVNNTPNAQAEFEVESVDGGVRIKAYIGSGKNVIVPETIDGKTVVAIGADVFSNNDEFQQIYVAEHVVEIDETAFKNSKNLVIVTTAGSAAHNYAAANSISYDLY